MLAVASKGNLHLAVPGAVQHIIAANAVKNYTGRQGISNNVSKTTAIDHLLLYTGSLPSLWSCLGHTGGGLRMDSLDCRNL